MSCHVTVRNGRHCGEGLDTSQPGRNWVCARVCVGLRWLRLDFAARPTERCLSRILSHTTPPKAHRDSLAEVQAFALGLPNEIGISSTSSVSRISSSTKMAMEEFAGPRFKVRGGGDGVAGNPTVRVAEEHMGPDSLDLAVFLRTAV